MATLTRRALGYFGSVFRKSANLTYAAAETSRHRKNVRVDNRAEDRILSPAKRDKIAARNRELFRDNAVARWMVNAHLDYTTSFRYQAKTDNREWNKLAEAYVRQRCRASNFDAAGRLSIERWMRLTELGRLDHGDTLHVRLSNLATQSIAGTRIRTPPNAKQDLRDGERWQNGVRLNRWDRATGYAVWSYGDNGTLEFDRVVPARNAYLHAYWTAVDGQARGVSPLTPAINLFVDSHESIEYAHAKAKASQIITWLFREQAAKETANAYATNPLPEPEAEPDETSEDDIPGDPVEPEGEDIDLTRGIQSVTIDKDTEDLEIIESNTPSTQFQDFQRLVVMYALKALNIPYCWLDEKHANFAGQVAALQRYKRASRAAIQDNQEMLQSLADWWIARAILDGELELPDGYTLDNLPHYWQPIGIEWWDKSKQVIGDLRAIGGGLDSPQRVCLENGRDFEEVIDDIADAVDYAESKGVTLNWGLPNEPRPSEGEERGVKDDED